MSENFGSQISFIVFNINMLVTFVLGFMIVYLFYKFFNKSSYWTDKNVKYYKWNFLLVLAWDFIKGRGNSPLCLKWIYENIHRDEPYVGFYNGTKPALLIRDLSVVQAITAGDFQSFHSRGITTSPNDTLADNVLFIDDYSRWKLIRQKLSPVFTKAKLRNMFNIISHCAKDFTKFIKENNDSAGTSFDLLTTYSAASLSASVFGVDVVEKNSMESPFIEMARQAVSPNIRAGFIVFVGNLFPWLQKLVDVRNFGRYENFFIGAVKNILKIRRNDKQKRNDFIDTCLEIQKNGALKDKDTGYELELTDELLAAQAFFFFAAGTDTTASTMHFTVLLLSNHPEILKKVHAEIDNIFNDVNDELAYDDLDKFVYLNKVVNESMRLFPAIGSFQRICTRNTVFPVGNLKIEKGTIVFVPTFAIHRDPKYYPNPDIFDPERFSPEMTSTRPSCSYLAFGEGNRICLGERFARLQVLAGLAWLLRRYTLEPQEFVPRFDKSFFAVRSSKSNFKLIPRSI